MKRQQRSERRKTKEEERGKNEMKGQKIYERKEETMIVIWTSF